MTDVDRIAQLRASEPLGTTFQNDLRSWRLITVNVVIADDEWLPDLIFDVAYGCAAGGTNALNAL